MRLIAIILLTFFISTSYSQNVDFKNLIAITITKLNYDTTIRASRYNVTFTRIEPRYDFASDSVYIDTLNSVYSNIDSNLLTNKLFDYQWDYYGRLADAHSFVLASTLPKNDLTLANTALVQMTGNNFLDNARLRHANQFTGRWILVHEGTRYRMLATQEADRIRFRQVDANWKPVQGGFNGRIRVYNMDYLSLVNVTAANTTINFVPDPDDVTKLVSTTGNSRLWKRRR